MRVNAYSVTGVGRDGAPKPRVWRITTDDGVYWLAQEGEHARLVRLPLPLGGEGDGAYPEHSTLPACEALVLTAETAAASRWVRAGPGRPAAARPAAHPTP